MYILGIDCYGHDSAAALMKNGELVALAEEERFVREKHTTQFPYHAIDYCLKEAGIQGTDLHYIGYYWRPFIGIGHRIIHTIRYFPASIQLIKSRKDKDLFPMLKIKDLIWETLNMDHHPAKFEYVEHHLAHASSTFFVSPFEEAAILSIDAVGEWTTTWFGYGLGCEIIKIKEIGFPHSIGMLYGAVTEYLGFKFASGEGKVMGLAPYGTPVFIDEFRKIVQLKPRGEFKLDLSYFDYHKYGRGHWVSEKFIDRFGPPRKPEGEMEQRFVDVAASLQLITEEVGLHMAEYLYQKTGLKALCLAGGVALNSVMNGRILQESSFSGIYVQPLANDAGTSLGVALYLDIVKNGGDRRFKMDHPYWGPHFDDHQVEMCLLRKNIPFEYLGHKVESRWESVERTEQKVEIAAAIKAAELLAQGYIIGWFQDRMEVGPRALGNRSILADPRNHKMKDILNEKVKHRESFRPFAPSILEECVGEYFECDYPSPFMILVYAIKKDKRNVIPAVTHIDGTGRIQTVSQKTNPKYWALINEFRKITRVPVILNTSFNVRGEPIVCTPEDALNCFLGTGMDYLFLGNYLIDKRKVPKELLWDSSPEAKKSEH